MRVHEVIDSIDSHTKAVDRTDGALTAALQRRQDAAVTGSGTGGAEGGVVVLVTDPREPTEGNGWQVLDERLSEIEDLTTAVIFVACPAHDLPTGQLIDHVLRNGLQVRDAVPVEHPQYGCAVVVTRCEGMAPISAYLAYRPAIEPGPEALRRVVAEYLIGGLAARAELEHRGKELETLRSRIAALETLARRGAAVESSRSYQVGLAFAALRTSPVSGSLHLPGRLARAGRRDH